MEIKNSRTGQVKARGVILNVSPVPYSEKIAVNMHGYTVYLTREEIALIAHRVGVSTTPF